MSDYTPTNVEVRVAYVAYRSSADTLQQARTLHTPIFGPEFDRWLAEVKAEAWEEGWCQKSLQVDGYEWDWNPYRDEETE